MEDLYDQLLNAKIQMHIGERLAPGKVVSRVIGPGGEQLGMYNNNPFLNTIMYQFEFDDGHIKEYGASIIAENMLTRVDEEGFSTTMMKCIIDYRKDDDVAIPKDKKYVTIPSGQKRLRTTTAGWKLLVEWADWT